MLGIIKRYELNDNVEIEDLIEVGFRRKDENKLKYFTNLYNDINLSLYVNIDDGEIKFNDEKDVLVYDSQADCSYFPFYDDKRFSYLENVISKYNEKMDHLVECEVLKYKEKDKQKSKTK